MDEDGVRKVAALLLPARFPFHGGRCSPNIVRYALQARPATEARRADARRFWLHTRLRLPIGVSDLQERYVTHGGLTPAALVNVRFCIADGAFCSEHTSCQPRQHKSYAGPGDCRNRSNRLRVIRCTRGSGPRGLAP